MGDSPPFPRLPQAPINEVVCGFLFDPIDELTSAQHGVYWVQRKSDFPSHEIQTPLVEPSAAGEVTFGLNAGDVRTWLISKDETKVLQLQKDRFLVNWRKRRDSDAYPRFKTSSVGQPQLLGYALGEFEMFSAFAKQWRLPRVHHVELTKIDVFTRGVHWADHEDLRKLLPWTKYSLDLARSQTPNLGLRVEDQVEDDCAVRVVVASGLHRFTKVPVIRMETTIRADCDVTGLEQRFLTMNEHVNSLFFKLIPSDQLKRFGVEK